MARVNYIYFEPRTGIVYTSEPRARNVYKLANSQAVREQLKKLSGQELVAWLENQR